MVDVNRFLAGKYWKGTSKTSGPMGLVAFYGVNVPIGFLASRAKSGHNACNGSGFIYQLADAKGNQQVTICECAMLRSKRSLRDDGPAKFTELAKTWFEGERKRLASNLEAR